MTPSDQAKAFKAVDSAWTVLLIDPLCARILPYIEHVRFITPVRLTVAAQAIGLGAAAAFWRGELLAGAILFELAFLLDCLDGKLARLRDSSTRLGAVLDANADRIVMLTCFIALAASAARPWLAVAIATAHQLAFILREQRDATYREAGMPRPLEAVSSTDLGSWVRRRRVYPTPTSVEIEHASLFVAPLVSVVVTDITVPTIVLASLFFAFQAVRFGMSALRAASRIDRSPPQEVS